MNTTAPVSYTFTVSVDDTSVLPKIKSALKCFKGVVSVRSSRHARVSVSPSNDPWFDDQNNIAMLDQAIEEARREPGTTYTAAEIRNMLGV